MNKKLLFLFIGLPVIVFSQPKKQRLAKVVDSFQAKYPSYGISIGVVNGGGTQYFAWGKTAQAITTPIDEHTEFEVGSVTKTFTGLLLAMAIEQHHLKKDSWIDGYLPAGFALKPAIQHAVKVTDLASHQSGLPNFNDDQYIINLFKANPEQPFKAVDSLFLYKVLGETDTLAGHGIYRYSNFGFALLGQVLQQATKTSYDIQLKQEILLPLKLKYTNLNPITTLPNAGFYDEDGNKKQPLDISVMKPAGGLHSNAADMVAFLKMQIAPPPSQLGRAIQLTHKPVYTDSTLAVGFGWEMQNSYIEKTGDTWGNSCIIRFSPAAKMGVVVLCDHHNSQVVQDIATALLAELKK